MTNEPNIESLLKIIVEAGSGLGDEQDAKSLGELAANILANPNHNSIKALEYAFKGVFDKLYENAPSPKQRFYPRENGIWLENEQLFVFTEKENVIEIHKNEKPIVTYNFKDEKAKSRYMKCLGTEVAENTRNIYKIMKMSNGYTVPMDEGTVILLFEHGQ